LFIKSKFSIALFNQLLVICLSFYIEIAIIGAKLLIMDLAWTKSTDEVLSYFNVDENTGYSDEQVKAAQEKYGPNELPAEEG
jgi:magnesium-transporting ATPase (P-type)